MKTKIDGIDFINQKHGTNWSLYHGDNVLVNKGIPSNSVDMTVFSPPFESLYTYSASSHDMGNCKSSDEFWEGYHYLIAEQYRVTKPGRLLSFHCMNLPTSKVRDGYIGIRDFRGELVRAYQDAGWIFHSEVCIWKDPVTAMTRTKALGLLHKQLAKDSAMSRQGIPDYLVTMRKPGVNPNPITGMLFDYIGDDPEYMRFSDNYNPIEHIEEFKRIAKKVIDAKFSLKKLPGGLNNFDVSKSIDIWQRYASPVWMDINPSDTLQYRSARENNQERHICPLQLQVISRALQLWSNAGDVVKDDFNGIGSTGYVCLDMGRKYIGMELKESYFNAAVKNLQAKESSAQLTLDFAELMSA